MKYSIKIDKVALEALAKLPKNVQRQIRNKIDDLSSNPYPKRCKPIKSAEIDNIYRIESGNYRIGYQVIKKMILILVIRIGHRKDFYKYFDRL